MRKSVPLLTILTLFLAACSTNPATGQRQISLVSEQQAIQLGMQAHQQTIQQFGIYDEKPELNQMVSRIGQRIAAASDRPNLPWTFTILDSPMVNAMALPGGYIYVTRGILERINTEDELAGVIGHEIAHVAAQHAEQRISRAQLTQLGLVLGSVLAGPQAAQAYGGIAELGAQLMFLRYSRDQETHADVLGTAYMAEAGFNPRGAEHMLEVLRRLDRGDRSALDQYFVSHPDPGKRVQTVRNEVTKLEQQGATFSRRPMDRTPFVRQLEGIIVGDSTLQTTIRDNTIYQRKYGMILQYPAGYQAMVAPGTLFAVAPERGRSGSQVVVQEVPLEQLRTRDVQGGVRAAVQKMGLRYVGTSRARTATGQQFDVDLWQGRTQQGVVAVETTQFVEGGNAVVFMEISPSGRSLAGTLQALRFDRTEARRAEPHRMKIGTVPQARSWADVAQRATGDSRHADTIAHINGFDSGTAVPATVLLKLPQDVARN
jgi:predicted Zn-dependent protease